jgi:plasmid stabilization system protein ParE
VHAAVLDACRRLAEQPGMGHARTDLTERPLKFWSVFSYLIVYEPDAAPLRIIAVMHAARDVESVLKSR